MNTLPKAEAYFEALDHVGGEIEKRFDQSDLASVCEVESLLLEAANGQNISEIPETVTMYFREMIDLARLKVQLPMLHEAVNTVSFTMSVKKVTNVKTLADIFNQKNCQGYAQRS